MQAFSGRSSISVDQLNRVTECDKFTERGHSQKASTRKSPGISPLTRCWCNRKAPNICRSQADIWDTPQRLALSCWRKNHEDSLDCPLAWVRGRVAKPTGCDGSPGSIGCARHRGQGV